MVNILTFILYILFNGNLGFIILSTVETTMQTMINVQPRIKAKGRF